MDLNKSIGILKPKIFCNENATNIVFENLYKHNILIYDFKELKFDKYLVENLYPQYKYQPEFDQLVKEMKQGPSMILILSCENVVSKWKNLVYKFENQNFEDLDFKNGFHALESNKHYEYEHQLFWK